MPKCVCVKNIPGHAAADVSRQSLTVETNPKRLECLLCCGTCSAVARSLFSPDAARLTPAAQRLGEDSLCQPSSPIAARGQQACKMDADHTLLISAEMTASVRRCGKRSSRAFRKVALGYTRKRQGKQNQRRDTFKSHASFDSFMENGQNIVHVFPLNACPVVSAFFDLIGKTFQIHMRGLEPPSPAPVFFEA